MKKQAGSEKTGFRGSRFRVEAKKSSFPNPASRTPSPVLARGSVKLKALCRALGDILGTVAHEFFAVPERQVAVARVKSGDRGRKSSG